MGTIVDHLDAILHAPGSNQKAELLKTLHPLGVEAFVYAFDPSKRFFTHVPSNDLSRAEFSFDDEVFFAKLFSVLDSCVAGQLRGNAAGKALDELWLSADPRQRLWGGRVISKNMRCGVGWGTFCKIHPGLLTAFRSQLCGTWGGGELNGNWIADAKIDGMRCYMVFNPEGSLDGVYSRSGKPVKGGEEIGRKLASFGVFRGAVLDGELFATDRFDSIGKSRRHGGDRSNLAFYPFDILDWDEWQVGSTKTLAERRDLLVDVCKEYWQVDVGPHPQILMAVPSHMIQDSSPQGLNQVITHFREIGFEGAVLKELNSPYDFTRSPLWLKAKPIHTGDYVLVGVLPGRGRLSNSAGTLVVSVNGVRVGVGTGLSDRDRKFFWQNRESLVEKRTVIEVAYQDVTPDGSLSFPRYVAVREDKCHEAESQSSA